MKVTKAIRDYIEEQVYYKADNCERFVGLKENSEKAMSEFEKDMDALSNKITEEMKKIAAKYSLRLRDGYKYHCSDTMKYDLPAVKEYDEARREYYEKKRKAVTEIIATMELGGTKAELLEMINNLEF